MTGILLVDKPEGISSAGAIRALKGRLGRAKVGHLGTLDPFASGLLPLCVGEATKVARYLLAERKAYTGTIRLGVATDTLDRTGVRVETAPLPALDQAGVDEVVTRFVGRQQQVPPMYSALKRGGVPLYKLARQGVDVTREAREIEVFSLKLVLQSRDRIDFAAACSKGTYLRVLASDIGVALGTVAHLEDLRRTAVGAFRVEEAEPLERLANGQAAAPLPLRGLREALGGYACFTLAAGGLARLRRGQQEPLAGLPVPSHTGQTALLLDPRGDVAAVIEGAVQGPAWRLVRILAVT
jgi:tRNA pseudouridine55 synthase